MALPDLLVHKESQVSLVSEDHQDPREMMGQEDHLDHQAHRASRVSLVQ